jgi:hypothetical protein
MGTGLRVSTHSRSIGTPRILHTSLWKLPADTRRTLLRLTKMGTEMKCLICESDEVIYSGTDAFMYGIGVTEKFCYRCAGAYYEISRYIETIKV